MGQRFKVLENCNVALQMLQACIYLILHTCSWSHFIGWITFHKPLVIKLLSSKTWKSTNTLHTITNGVSWPLLNNRKSDLCCEELHFLLFAKLHISSYAHFSNMHAKHDQNWHIWKVFMVGENLSNRLKYVTITPSQYMLQLVECFPHCQSMLTPKRFCPHENDLKAKNKEHRPAHCACHKFCPSKHQPSIFSLGDSKWFE